MDLVAGKFHFDYNVNKDSLIEAQIKANDGKVDQNL